MPWPFPCAIGLSFFAFGRGAEQTALAWAGAGLLAATGAVRAVRMEIRVKEGLLIARNLFITRRVPLVQIAEIVVVEGGMAGRLIGVQLRNGGRRLLGAIVSIPSDGPTFVERVVPELDRMARRTSATGGGDPGA